MNNPVIFFDGECNLCNGFVRILLTLDKRIIFRYASLQSPVVKNYPSVSENIGIPYQTVAVYFNEKVYFKSDAIFFIINRLDYPWKILKLFGSLPKKFLDWIYDLIAHNRVKLFGRNEKCSVRNEKYNQMFIQ
jgi:predicted DCC family thiol-disulfide oxidoreductase YuxK